MNNSNTGNTYIRQTGLVDPIRLDIPISIIGAGGIGSWTALALLKMGCSNVTVYDFDTVEEHNLGSQIYTHTDIGELKVEALKSKLSLLTSTQIHTATANVNTMNMIPTTSIVILAVDNIDTRKQVFEALEGTNCVLIDGRMAGNAIEIYTVKPDDPTSVKAYQDTLFEASEALPIPCSERAVVYNCFVMSGLITDLVGKYSNH